MRIAMVLSSLCAEGTPVLALDMAKIWRRLGVDFGVWTFLDQPTDLKREFADAGISVQSLSLSLRGYAKFPALVYGVSRMCRQNSIDSIVSFPFGWHSYVAWGGALAGARKIVAHAGNYPPVANVNAIRKLRTTLAIGKIWHPKIACCSDYVRGGIARHLRLPASNLHTIYNGIDLKRFCSPIKPSPPTARPVRIGMVARFEPHKDQPTLLRAVRDLSSRGIDVRLDLVGEGSRSAEYKHLTSALQIQNRVSFLGVRRDIPQLLRTWDLFVFSVTPDEGLGVALIEALAAGVPVIASNVGACREVLNCPTYGPLGALVPAGDSFKLADAIAQFHEGPEPWWERAEPAKASMLARFSIEAMSQGYLKLLGAI